MGSDWRGKIKSGLILLTFVVGGILLIFYICIITAPNTGHGYGIGCSETQDPSQEYMNYSELGDIEQNVFITGVETHKGNASHVDAPGKVYNKLGSTPVRYQNQTYDCSVVRP
jgi:hypothetical protein